VSIWSKREDPPARPASAPVPPIQPAPAAPAASVPPVSYATEAKKESVPVSTTPSRTTESESRNNIGKAVRVVGQIFTKEDLYVDGDVEGTIESLENKITVGPNGRVQAGIRAREVVILGQVQGNVEATDKVDIRKEAKLVGDITTSRISIEDGALFKGSIDIKKQEVKASSAPVIPTPPAGPVSAAPSPVSAATAAAGAAPIRR
jgi:cytoskeletal protein CcmA (bactofilin family)